MSVSQIINVIVNSKGAVTVTKQLNAMGESARTTTTYLNSLRAILASALTFSGVSAITKVADEFTNLQNKLRIVSDESNTVAQSWTRLMQIANNSYSTIDSTVDLYFRVAQAYKAWGESAEKAYQFTELFQKAAILSGSSMQTTSQAVYQFGQALNKGKLDGDEFRSVLEGLPYVANILQKSLGVTRAELYKMSAQGKISIDRIKEAFESAASTITQDWTKVTPTIGMAMNVLRSNWVDFVGEIQTSTGVFSGIAQVILLVANNFKLLAVALAPVALSLAFLAGRAGLGLVVIGFKDMAEALKLATAAQWLFNVAVSANPYVIAITIITAVIAAIVYFREELGLTTEVFNNLWSTAVQVFTYIFTTLNPIGALLDIIVQQFGGWLAVWEAIKSVAIEFGVLVTGLFTSIAESASSLAQYMGEALAPVFTELSALAQNFFGLVKDIFDTFKDLLTPAIVALEPAFKKVWDYIEPTLSRFLKILGDIYQGWINIANYIKISFFPIIKDAFEGWIIIIRKIIDFVSDLISALRTALSVARQLSGASPGGAAGGGGAHYGAQFYAGEFASGGQFKVGGTNSGRDTTPVAFRAERGERVTVETKKQQRQADNANVTPSVNVPVQIVNVIDPQTLAAAMQTQTGVKVLKNVITVNREEFKGILGVV